MKKDKNVKFIPMSVIFILIFILIAITSLNIVYAINNDKDFVLTTNRAARDSFDSLVIYNLKQKAAALTFDEFWNLLQSENIINEDGHINLKNLINTNEFLSYGIGSNGKDEYILEKNLMVIYMDEYSNEEVVGIIDVIEKNEEQENQNQENQEQVNQEQELNQEETPEQATEQAPVEN